MACSRLRIWAGERSLSKMTTSASVGLDQLLELVDLALAEVRRHVGGLRRWVRRPTTRPRPFRPGRPVRLRGSSSWGIGQKNADQNGRLTLYALITFEFLHRFVWAPSVR